jgi:hypothetical protein
MTLCRICKECSNLRCPESACFCFEDDGFHEDIEEALDDYYGDIADGAVEKMYD